MPLYPSNIVKRADRIGAFLHHFYGNLPTCCFLELRWAPHSELSNTTGPYSEMFPTDNRGLNDMVNRLFDIFIMLPHSVSFTPQPRIEPSTKSELLPINRWFWADIDDIPKEHYDRWISYLALKMNASYIFRSGNGLHVYWLSDNCPPQKTIDKLFRMAPYALWGDPHISRSHLMRVPWSANCKAFPLQMWMECLYQNEDIRTDFCKLAQSWEAEVKTRYPNITDSQKSDTHSTLLAEPQRQMSAKESHNAGMFALKKCPLFAKSIRFPRLLNRQEWIGVAYLCCLSGLNENSFHKISQLDQDRYKYADAHNVWNWVCDHRNNPTSCIRLGIHDDRCNQCRGIGRMARDMFTSATTKST